MYFEKPYDAVSLKKQYRQLCFIHHPDKGGNKETFSEMKNEFDNLMLIYASNTEKSETNKDSRPKNGFGWEISVRPIFNEHNIPISGYKAIYGQYGNLINVCKKSYTPTTNAKFTEMVNYVAQIAGSETTNYFTFSNGRKVLAFIKTNPQTIAGFNYDRYLMVGSAHDGSSAFFMGVTQVMTRCANQFTEKNKQFKAWHTINHETHLQQIKSIFSDYTENTMKLSEKIESFKSKKITANEKNRFIKFCLDIPMTEKIENLSARKRSQVFALNEAIVSETKELGINAFGLFEGATYYTTHILHSKQRTFGNVFGVGADINSKAMEFCTAL